MLIEKIQKYNIILGSSSPRRAELLNKLGIKFTVEISNDKEFFSEELKGNKIAEFLAVQKAESILKKKSSNYLLITADTIVVINDTVLHKPKDRKQAIKTLKMLSGKTHEVITGVCIKSEEKEVIFSSTSFVKFNKLTDKEILFYITKFNPFDKAGAYGIQEWIGNMAIEKINGSYNNIVGLPTSKLYQKLKLFI